MRGARACAIDHEPAAEPLARGQGHALDAVCVPVHRHNLILHIFSAFFLGHALAPIKNRAAVKIAFVDGVMIACGNVAHMIKRIFGLNFRGCHMPRASAHLCLQRLTVPQAFGPSGAIGQIHIAKRLDMDFRNTRVVIKIALKIVDKLRAKLADLDIGWV